MRERRSVRKRGQNGGDRGKRGAPFEASFEAQGKQSKHFEAQHKRARICCDKHGGE